MGYAKTTIIKEMVMETLTLDQIDSLYKKHSNEEDLGNKILKADVDGAKISDDHFCESR